MTMAFGRTLRNWILFLWIVQTLFCANVIDSFTIQLEDPSGRVAAAIVAAEEEMSDLPLSVESSAAAAAEAAETAAAAAASSSSPSSSSSFTSGNAYSELASPSDTFRTNDHPTPDLARSGSIDHSGVSNNDPKSVINDNISGSHTANAQISISSDSIITNESNSMVSENDRIFSLYPVPADCIFVKTEEGIYSFVSSGSNIICGLYFIARPEYLVEIEFLHFDITCGQNNPSGLLSVVDGWELNGQFFPGIQDHEVPREARYHEFCGPIKPRKKFRLSQNAGLIEYRIPTPAQGFIVRVKFIENPKPCNVIIQDFEGVYTLRNYGRRINCTVSLIFDISFTILSMNVGGSYRPLGNVLSSRNYVVETGIIKKCKKRGKHDYVEFLGGKGLDPHAMTVAEDICGVRSISLSKTFTVSCPHSAVRLVSSGKFDNAFDFTFNAMNPSSVPSLVCPFPFK